MANVIAAHCRNFRRLNAIGYQVAIADWETDLEYLRGQYYDGMFDWPPTEND
jgi:hypothetical protein